MARGMFLNIPDSWFEKAEEMLVPQLESKGREVSSNVSSQYETGVLVRKDRNGRPVALVSLMHPNGVLIQAKDGVLTRAAAQAGLKTGRYKT